MANLKNIKDDRPFTKGEAFGYQNLADAFANDIELQSILRTILADDGSPNVRNFVRMTGNYLYAAGSYALVKQAGFTSYLPASITTATGVIGISFTQSLPETTYDVQLTPARSSSSSYATMQYDLSTKSASALTCYSFLNGVGAVLDGFSISICWG